MFEKGKKPLVVPSNKDSELTKEQQQQQRVKETSCIEYIINYWQPQQGISTTMIFNPNVFSIEHTNKLTNCLYSIVLYFFIFCQSEKDTLVVSTSPWFYQHLCWWNQIIFVCLKSVFLSSSSFITVPLSSCRNIFFFWVLAEEHHKALTVSVEIKQFDCVDLLWEAVFSSTSLSRGQK